METSAVWKKIHALARLAIMELFEQTSHGDHKTDAAKLLFQITRESVFCLEALCHHNPKLLEPIARKASSWPGFLTCDPASEASSKVMLEKLNFCKEPYLNYKRDRLLGDGSKKEGKHGKLTQWKPIWLCFFITG